MKRKVVSMMLVAAMCTSAVSGMVLSAKADGDTITYTGYWSGPDYQDGSYVESYIEENLGIDIEVIKQETSDTLDTLLASGEMPDCAWLDKEVGWMYEQELVRTIPKAMVEEYAPSLIKTYDENPLLYKSTLDPENEEEFKYLTGVTYQFCDYYLPNDYYRYDWIQNLGIDLGVEVEEVADRVFVAKDGIELSKFEEIMDGFVNGDPDGNGQADTVGATGTGLGAGPFLSAFGLGVSIQEDNGKAAWSYAREEYKDYLKGMADLWAKGLIDPEIITGNRNLSWDKVNKGNAGYWITSTNSLNSWAVDRPPLTLLEANPDATILMTPGIKPDGGKVQGSVDATPAYGNFYVRYDVSDEKLADILRFIEFTIFGNGDDTIHTTMIWGEEGVDWEWNEDKTAPVKLKNLQSGEKGTWTFGQFGQTESITKIIGEEPMFEAGLKYWGRDGVWMDYGTFPYKNDFAGETQYEAIRAEINGDLSSYVTDYRTRAIMGDIDVDATWDEYQAELDRLGYNEMMAELDQLKTVEEIVAEYK